MKATLVGVLLLPMLFFTDTNASRNNEAAIQYKEAEVDKGIERFSRLFVKGNEIEREIDSIEILITELELQIEKSKTKKYEK